MLTVEAELKAPACVQSLAVNLTLNQQPARAFRQVPDAAGRVHYEARLPTGHYRMHVSLRCADRLDVAVVNRPLEVGDDDVQVPLTITSSCGCAS